MFRVTKNYQIKKLNEYYQSSLASAVENESKKGSELIYSHFIDKAEYLAQSIKRLSGE